MTERRNSFTHVENPSPQDNETKPVSQCTPNPYDCMPPENTAENGAGNLRTGELSINERAKLYAKNILDKREQNPRAVGSIKSVISNAWYNGYISAKREKPIENAPSPSTGELEERELEVLAQKWLNMAAGRRRVQNRHFIYTGFIAGYRTAERASLKATPLTLTAENLPAKSKLDDAKVTFAPGSYGAMLESEAAKLKKKPKSEDT